MESSTSITAKQRPATEAEYKDFLESLVRPGTKTLIADEAIWEDLVRRMDHENWFEASIRCGALTTTTVLRSHELEVTECEAPGCVLFGSYHLVDRGADADHVGRTLSHPEYKLRMRRYGAEPWFIAVDCEDLEPAHVTPFTNDLQQLSIECARLNGAAA